MKTSKSTALGFALLLAQTVWAQDADDFVTWGRASLAATNAVAANAAFSYALALEPDHQTANALRAITRLLVLPNQRGGSNFLNRLGFPVLGRDIYHWTADLPKDTNGVPVAPAGMSAEEFTAELRTNVLNAVIAAQANLASVTDTNFLLSLTANETRAAPVTVDHGDIQMLRAILRGLEYFIYTIHSWNVDAQLSAIRSWYAGEGMTIARLLMDYPSLLTFATTNDLDAAKLAFLNGVERYLAASEFIRSRSTNVTRLFNYDEEQAGDEQDFRWTLIDLTNSLNGAVTLRADTNYTVFLASHFSGMSTVRSVLPAFSENRFVLGTLPDVTFGGLIYGLGSGGVEDFLAGCFETVPLIGPYGLTGGAGFQLQLHVLAGRGYVIQVSTNLEHWSDSYPFVSRSDMFDIIVSAGSGARRFYRLVDRTESMPPPRNDNFADRMSISSRLPETAYGYNASSTIETNEPGYPWAGTAWWTWTAPVSGTVVITTEGSPSHPYAQIYTGNFLASLNFVAYDGEPFYAVAGTAYQIQVVEGGSPPGGIKLTITAPPVLTVLNPRDGSVFNAPTNILISASATDPDGSIRRLKIFGDGDLLARTFSPLQHSLSVTWSNVSLGFHTIEVTAMDNLGVNNSSNLFVRISPPNDNFADRIGIESASTTVTGPNGGASREAYEPYHAGYAGTGSVWWSWTAPSSRTVAISAHLSSNGSAFGYLLLGVYQGTSVSDLTAVAADAASFFGDSVLVSFSAIAGTTYQIAVDEWYGYNGTITLNVVP